MSKLKTASSLMEFYIPMLNQICKCTEFRAAIQKSSVIDEDDLIQEGCLILHKVAENWLTKKDDEKSNRDGYFYISVRRKLLTYTQKSMIQVKHTVRDSSNGSRVSDILYGENKVVVSGLSTSFDDNCFSDEYNNLSENSLMGAFIDGDEHVQNIMTVIRKVLVELSQEDRMFFIKSQGLCGEKKVSARKLWEGSEYKSNRTVSVRINKIKEAIKEAITGAGYHKEYIEELITYNQTKKAVLAI